MLTPRKLPARYRDLIEDEGATIWISGGQWHVVDGVKCPSAPGRIVAHGRRLLVTGGQVLVEGLIEVVAACRARITMRYATGTGIDNSHFVLLNGSEARLTMHCTFEASDNARVELSGSIVGRASDYSIVTVREDYEGDLPQDIEILGPHVTVKDHRLVSTEVSFPVATPSCCAVLLSPTI